MFAAAFLYIGACELVLRSYVPDPKPHTSLASLVGIALMCGITVWAR